MKRSGGAAGLAAPPVLVDRQGVLPDPLPPRANQQKKEQSRSAVHQAFHSNRAGFCLSLRLDIVFYCCGEEHGCARCVLLLWRGLGLPQVGAGQYPWRGLWLSPLSHVVDRNSVTQAVMLLVFGEHYGHHHWGAKPSQFLGCVSCRGGCARFIYQHGINGLRQVVAY